MFASFKRTHPAYFAHHTTSFDLLSNLETEIHAEIRKLDDGADLPAMEAERQSSHGYIFIYRSKRRLIEVCHGAIEASMAYYREAGHITRNLVETPVESIAVFHVHLTQSSRVPAL